MVMTAFFFIYFAGKRVAIVAGTFPLAASSGCGVTVKRSAVRLPSLLQAVSVSVAAKTKGKDNLFRIVIF